MEKRKLKKSRFQFFQKVEKGKKKTQMQNFKLLMKEKGKFSTIHKSESKEKVFFCSVITIHEI